MVIINILPKKMGKIYNVTIVYMRAPPPLSSVWVCPYLLARCVRPCRPIGEVFHFKGA